MKRNIRRVINIVITAAGIGIIFTVLFVDDALELRAQLPLALLGILLMEAGVWGLSTRILPSERRFSALREEGDKMMGLIRELNAAAIAKDTGIEDAKRFQATLQSMHDCVAHMSELAAREDSPRSAKKN